MGCAGARAGRADGVRRGRRDAGVLQSALRLMPPTGLRYRFHTIGIGAGFRRCGPAAWPNRPCWDCPGRKTAEFQCSDYAPMAHPAPYPSVSFPHNGFCSGTVMVRTGITASAIVGSGEAFRKPLKFQGSHVFMVCVGIPPAPDSAGIPPRLRNSPQSPMVWNSDHRMTALCATGGRMCVQYHLLPG